MPLSCTAWAETAEATAAEAHGGRRAGAGGIPTVDGVGLVAALDHAPREDDDLDAPARRYGVPAGPVSSPGLGLVGGA